LFYYFIWLRGYYTANHLCSKSLQLLHFRPFSSKLASYNCYSMGPDSSLIFCFWDTAKDRNLFSRTKNIHVIQRKRIYFTINTKLRNYPHNAVHFVLNKPWHKLSHDHDSVTQMLTSLGWPELQDEGKLLLLFKIMRGLLEVPSRCIPQQMLYTATRAYHMLKLEHICSRTDLPGYKNSFLPRSIPTWNDLNIPNIDTISLDDFKKELSKLINWLYITLACYPWLGFANYIYNKNVKLLKYTIG